MRSATPWLHSTGGLRRSIPPLLLLLLWSVASESMAQPIKREPLPGVSHSTGRAAVTSLGRDLMAILSDRNLSDATWGISIVSCDNGEPLFRYNDGRNRQIASNIKLLTTATALYRFGGDYRYTTDLYVGGDVAPNGELRGNVVIRASGDPSISPSFGVDPREMIKGWASALDSAGITSVQDIVVDASYFDNVPYAPGWSWDDEPYGFNAQISAAAIYDNSIEVTVTPGRTPGSPVSIDISPSTAYVALKVTAVTSRNDSTATIDIRRERNGSMIVVAGNIAAGAEPYVDHISVEKPPLFFATLVKEEFERLGIMVRGETFDMEEYPEHISYTALRRLAGHISPPMREIVSATNKQSLNLAAEMLTKKLGRAYGGIGSTSAGIETIRKVLGEAGIDIEHIRIFDGSGLSRQDMIAPADITTLLQWVWRSSIARDFMASLAVAGKDGTLINRLRGTLAEGNVIGKTGYLNSIRAISGYARTRDGELVAFSIVANNYSVPTSVVNTAQDLIVMRLASFSRKS